MTTSQFFILISIVVLAVVALFVFFLGRKREENRLTPLAGLAFGFILAGIVFGENRFLGYSLMGIGLVLAVVDIFMRSRTN